MSDPPVHSCINAWLVLNEIHARVERQITKKLLESCGLTAPEFEALVRIRSEAAGLRQGDIGACVELSQPAISRMVDRFEQRGLIQRDSDPSDKRATRLSLTASGTDLTDQATAVFAETVHHALGVLLTDEQQSAILELFGPLQTSQ